MELTIVNEHQIVDQWSLREFTMSNTMSCIPQNYAFTCVCVCVAVRDVRVKSALPFEQMSGNSKRYLEASGEWELVVILGEEGILSFGIDEWDIITFWVRERNKYMH